MIYTSLSGETLHGARLALERFGGPELVLGDAGAAAADPRTLAFLGDFRSADVAASAPVLAAAGVLQVAPVATFSGLGGETLVRLMPDDRALARGIADWLVREGIGSVDVVFDHDDYGISVGDMCAVAARDRGLTVTPRPVWDDDEHVHVHGKALLYVGVAGSGAVGLFNDLPDDLWRLGTDGVAAPWLAEELTPAAAARTRFFSAHAAPWAFYGYAAMEHVLGSLREDRAATLAAGRAPGERDCVLGPYALDADGLTTRPATGVQGVAGGELVWLP